jgi:hypothetical protein
MVDRIADDDFIDIADEESDEESVLSDDSACISDCSENLVDLVERVVPFSELHALNLNTRHCLIQFYYYSIEEPGICASCMIRLLGNEMGVLHAVRHHETGFLGALNGQYCSQCAMPMFTYIPCNMCSICGPSQ